MPFHKTRSKIDFFFRFLAIPFVSMFVQCNAMETPNYDNTVNDFFNKLTCQNNICPNNSYFVIHKDHSVKDIDAYLDRKCISHDVLVARYIEILVTLKEKFEKESKDNEWRGVLGLLTKAIEDINKYTIPPKSGLYATSLYTNNYHERCVNHPIQFIRILVANMSRKIDNKSLDFEWDPHTIYIHNYSETTFTCERTLQKSSNYLDFMGSRGWKQTFFPYSNLINENFKKLNTLTKLDLSNTILKSLPEEIDTLTTLKVLNLGYNELIELPADMSSLVRLEELYITHNHLKEFPFWVGSLNNLKVLNLQDNKFKRVFDIIAHCTGLVSLNLSQMHKLKIPESLSMLTNLTHLELSVIHKFPSSIQSLISLKKLDFRIKTKYFYPPKELANLLNLQELLITWNSPKDEIHAEFYAEPSTSHGGELVTLKSCFEVFFLMDKSLLIERIFSNFGDCPKEIWDIIKYYYWALSKPDLKKITKNISSSKAEYLSKYFNFPHFRNKKDLSRIHQQNAFYP